MTIIQDNFSFLGLQPWQIALIVIAAVLTVIFVIVGVIVIHMQSYTTRRGLQTHPQDSLKHGGRNELDSIKM
jgi:hypothetical protein